MKNYKEILLLTFYLGRRKEIDIINQRGSKGYDEQ
ncbi:uncharacterized protein METZ01_LOCUS379646 [marine metagenome]|uniref:Uncharacterized protein n=1 Tax=marine metagenome TaxID=408172 RepID=A0A382TYJ3_9ZZZZ